MPTLKVPLSVEDLHPIEYVIYVGAPDPRLYPKFPTGTAAHKGQRGNAACSPQLPRLLVTSTVYPYYNYLYNKRGDAEGEQESVDNPQQDVDDDDAAVRGG